MMDDTVTPPTLREYWGVLVRRRITVLVVLACCVGAAGLLVLSTERQYRAETLVIVRSTASSSVFGTNAQGSADARRRVANEISVIEGVEVRQRVKEDLGLTVLPPRAAGAPNAGDDTVAVSVVSTDSELAARLANAYVAAYNEVKREQVVDDLARAVDELQGQISRLQDAIDGLDASLDDPDLSAQDRDLYQAQRRELVAQQSVFQRSLDQRQVDANLVNNPAQVVEPAKAPTAPFQPTPVRTGLLAVFMGLVLGIAVALVRDRLDQSIKVAADLTKVGSTLPVLARVPPATAEGRLAALGVGDPVLETYRTLRTNMQFIAIDRELQVVQVTSAIPGEGKTTTASNLAVVLSQAEKRVLLLDADLRKPMVHEAFGLGADTGLVDVLVGRPFEGVVQHVSDHLDVLPAGRVPVNPSEMLSSRRMGELVADLRTRYDVIVVDSAPVLPVSDAAALSRHVDGVLVVVQAGGVSVPQVRQSIAALDQVHAPLVGIVLNKVKPPSGRRQGYGYGYGYGQTASAAASID